MSKGKDTQDEIGNELNIGLAEIGANDEFAEEEFAEEEGDEGEGEGDGDEGSINTIKLEPTPKIADESRTTEEVDKLKKQLEEVESRYERFSAMKKKELFANDYVSSLNSAIKAGIDKSVFDRVYSLDIEKSSPEELVSLYYQNKYGWDKSKADARVSREFMTGDDYDADDADVIDKRLDLDVKVVECKEYFSDLKKKICISDNDELSQPFDTKFDSGILPKEVLFEYENKKFGWKSGETEKMQVEAQVQEALKMGLIKNDKESISAFAQNVYKIQHFDTIVSDIVKKVIANEKAESLLRKTNPTVIQNSKTSKATSIIEAIKSLPTTRRQVAG